MTMTLTPTREEKHRLYTSLHVLSRARQAVRRAGCDPDADDEIPAWEAEERKAVVRAAKWRKASRGLIPELEIAELDEVLPE